MVLSNLSQLFRSGTSCLEGNVRRDLVVIPYSKPEKVTAAAMDTGSDTVNDDAAAGVYEPTEAVESEEEEVLQQGNRETAEQPSTEDIAGENGDDQLFVNGVDGPRHR